MLIAIKEVMTDKELKVRHLDEELIFDSEPIGDDFIPKDFLGIMGRSYDLLRPGKNRLLPTAAETASLLYAAFQNRENEQFKSVRRAADIEGFGLLCDTAAYFTPNKGVYIEDYLSKVALDQFVLPLSDESDLIKRLEAKDERVRFVPFDFVDKGESEHLSPEEMRMHPLIKAICGEEGREKLAEIANSINEFSKWGHYCYGVNGWGRKEYAGCLDCDFPITETLKKAYREFWKWDPNTPLSTFIAISTGKYGRGLPTLAIKAIRNNYGYAFGRRNNILNFPKSR